MSSLEHKKKIWDLIKKIKVGMLIIIDDQADMHAIPMHLVQDDYDGTIWFFTDLNSEKAFDLQNRRSICLTFEDHGSDTYVSLSGYAVLSKDANLIKKFWNPFVAAWFPEGKTAPNVGLIEIKINKGEHWESKDSHVIQFFKMMKSNVTKEKPDLGKNQKFG